MQITAKTEYAVRAIYELVNRNCICSIKSICKAQNLPIKFVEKLFRKLGESGIIASKKGKKGGYYLSKKPSEVSLKNLMDALDEGNGLYCFNNKDTKNYCKREDCIFIPIWLEIKNHFDDYFSQISLEGLYKKLGG